MSSSWIGRRSVDARDRARDRAQRRQAAAREDVRVGEAPLGLLDVVGALVDRDRLEQHRAVRRQQRRAALEEGVEVLPADGLDHLDRDELVEGPLELAVVLQQQRDAVVDAGGADALGGERVLLGGDRRRRHAAAVARGGVDREAAPAGADLEHVVARRAGRACGRCGRASRAAPRAARPRARRRSRRSTSSSRRA